MVVAVRGQAGEPPRPVPRRLRPFLHFTRLPDKALPVARRALEDDDEFRHLVRDATSEELVGRASWLFLDRPPGWEDELGSLAVAAQEEASAALEARTESAAVRKLAVAEDARQRAEDDVAQLAEALAEVKDQLAGERKSRSRAESDAGRWRGRASDLESELARQRALLAERDAVLAGAAPPHTENGDVAGTGPDPGTAGDAWAGGTSGPQPGLRELAEAVSAGLEVVRARAAELSVALADIEGHLAPFLAVPASAPPPAPPTAAAPPSGRRRRPVDLPPAVIDDSVEAAEHLMRVTGIWVLVDGYNVTKLARPELALAEQRQWLVDAAAEMAARTGARIEVVFDGAGEVASAPADVSRRTGVQVRYSPLDLEADDLLLDLVADLGDVPTVVASDDRRVRVGAMGLGANVVSVRQLLAVLRRPLPT